MTDASKVHVLSCVAAVRDADLVGHFVRHYEQLGIARDHLHLIVHAAPEHDAALAAVNRRLHGLGIQPASVWRGVYTSGAMWRRRRSLQRDVVPAGAWVINADIDELHVYPAPLSEVIGHLETHDLNLLQGPMIDRLSPDGRLRRVKPLGSRRRRSLSQQFPMLADVMCPIGGITSADDADGTVKMMLHRAEVLPGIGGHAPWMARHGPWRRENVAYAAGRPLADFPEVVDAQWRLAQPAAVHHYKWTAGLADAVRRRRDAQGASAHGSAYGDRVIDYLRRHGGRIRLEDVTTAVPTQDTSTLVSQDWQEWWRTLRESPLPPLPDTPRRRPLSEDPPRVADGWRIRRLTQGTREGRFHTHSYYDIPVLDDSRTLVVAHQASIEDRWMTPQDSVTVGVIDVARGGFEPIAQTTAWSWQQGPLAQWVPGGRQLVWNDREGDRFVARLHDLDTAVTRSLPHSVYALAPSGGTALGLDMARLSRARPGYGYFGGDNSGADALAPADDGVRRIGLADGSTRLLLSLADAVAYLHSALPQHARDELASVPHLYWFNHAKFSPDGRRFTVKLRWRVATLERPWQGTQSASLTVAADGSDLRLLCRAASHVMWRNNHETVLWDEVRERVSVVADHAPNGELVRDLPDDVFGQNVHIHPLSERPGSYLYDVPYAETVQLRRYDELTGMDQQLAQFDRHQPPHGPFRCDLHPVPTADGELTILTSLHDGARQVYALERDG